MVVVLLAVFAVFIWVTIMRRRLRACWRSAATRPVSKIIASIALTFFAFLGFGVITFTVGDLPIPSAELPKAMYLALGVTTATYVLISLGVFGTLTVDQVDRLRRDRDRRGGAAVAR